MTKPFSASDAEPLLASLIDRATRAGADAADAVLFHSLSHGVSWRLGNLEDVERAEALDLGLRIMVGKRFATVSTTDIAHKNLDDLVARCAAMAKAAPEDPYMGLAPEDRLAKGPFPDLELGDFDEPATETLKERAAACEAAALAIEGVVNSSGAGASYGEGRKWLATSHGFFGESGGASHSVSVSVLAQDANGMETDYDYDSKTHYADMRAPDAIGQRAGERAVRRLSPRKVKSCTAPVIYSDRLSSSLVSHLAGAINGAAIARGVSFLKSRKGQQILPAGATIIDDPFRKRGHGSRPFDGEGVLPAPLKIIEDGVLTDWIMNSAQARQLGLETNGRATRGAGGGPGSSTTNFHLERGQHRVEDLIREARNGLFLDDMFGPQVNPNTGDYSVGCSGFWIENGEISYPVAEITIAGNLLEMYKDFLWADDLVFRGSTNAPTIMVQRMTIAGD